MRVWRAPTLLGIKHIVKIQYAIFFFLIEIMKEQLFPVCYKYISTAIVLFDYFVTVFYCFKAYMISHSLSLCVTG